MTENALISALALQKIGNIGDITAKKLIHHCGSVEAVFSEKKTALLKIDGIGDYYLRDLHNKAHFKAAEQELRFIKKHNIICHYFLEELYPEKLKHCIDGPILLFQRGNINLRNHHIISIVGTRKITNYGVDFCQSIVEALAPYNPIIVSGFAYGTDITAQKAALNTSDAFPYIRIGSSIRSIPDFHLGWHLIVLPSLERRNRPFI